jgi:hypothetical protein
MFSAASKSASSGLLTMVTFTSNGTWVAPATVSNVAIISGNGSNGVSDYVTGLYSFIFGAVRGTPSPLNAPYAQWGDLYSGYTDTVNILSAISYPNYGPSSVSVGFFTTVNSSDQWSSSTPTIFNLSSVYLTGYSTSTGGSPQTSGNITYASLPSGGVTFWGGNIQGYAQGNAGTASTGLGKTFPGGSYTGTYPNGVGGVAPTTSFTNVAVTPSASYSIVVPSGGSVTIQYYG